MTDPERPLGAEPSMESLPPCMLELEPSLASMDSAGHMPPRRLSSTSGAGGEARTAGSGGGWRPLLQVEDSQDLVGMEVDEIKPFDERGSQVPSQTSDDKYNYMKLYDAQAARPKSLAEVALEARLAKERQEEANAGPLQVLAQRVVASPYFENGIIVLILANCVSLALFRPYELEEPGSWNWTLGWIENVFNFCFTGEIVVRLVARGKIVAHFSSPWNVFDFFIVLVGYSAFVNLGSSGAESLRALRALRALRPLRTVSQVKSLRQIANSFVEAMPMLLSVVGVLFFYLVVSAICGLSLFMEGIHHRCGDEEFRIPREGEAFGCNYGGGGRICPDATPVCLNHEKVAEGYKLRPETWPGFDNFFQSFITVFISTTLEGWQDIMYRSVDGTSYFAILYFVLLVLTGPFFIVNLFLAVLKIKFADVGQHEKEVEIAESLASGMSSMKQHPSRKVAPDAASKGPGPVSESMLVALPEERSYHAGQTCPPSMREIEAASLTSADKRLEAAHSPRMLGMEPISWEEELEMQLPNRHPVMQWTYHLVQHENFNTFFLLCIGLNTVCLAMDHHNMPKSLENFLTMANYVLTALFALELVLKLVGLTLRFYFKDWFNCFDFVIVAISIVEIMPFMNSGTGVSLTALRSFRVLRVFKLFKHMPALAKIVGVLLSSAASFFSIGLLLFLFLTVFSIIGLHVYGEIGQLEGTRGHFKDIFNSYILLFQVLTLENWNSVMMSVAMQSNYYSVRIHGILETIFFLLWVVFGNYILLTLFLAVVMEAFEGKYDIDEEMENEKSSRIRDFASRMKAGTMQHMVTLMSSLSRKDVQLPDIDEDKEDVAGYIGARPPMAIQGADHSLTPPGTVPASLETARAGLSTPGRVEAWNSTAGAPTTATPTTGDQSASERHATSAAHGLAGNPGIGMIEFDEDEEVGEPTEYRPMRDKAPSFEGARVEADLEVMDADKPRVRSSMDRGVSPGPVCEAAILLLPSPSPPASPLHARPPPAVQQFRARTLRCSKTDLPNEATSVTAGFLQGLVGKLSGLAIQQGGAPPGPVCESFGGAPPSPYAGRVASEPGADAGDGRTTPLFGRRSQALGSGSADTKQHSQNDNGVLHGTGAVQRVCQSEYPNLEGARGPPSELELKLVHDVGGHTTAHPPPGNGGGAAPRRYSSSTGNDNEHARTTHNHNGSGKGEGGLEMVDGEKKRRSSLDLQLARAREQRHSVPVSIPISENGATRASEFVPMHPASLDPACTLMGRWSPEDEHVHSSAGSSPDEEAFKPFEQAGAANLRVLHELDADVAAINQKALAGIEILPAKSHSPAECAISVEAAPPKRAAGSRRSSIVQVLNKTKQLWVKAVEARAQELQADPTSTDYLTTEHMQLQGKSLWLFPVEDKFRQAAHSVVTSSKFETLMLMCILVSCIQMSIEVQDISKESDLGVVLRFTDIITTSIFTLECALKTVELGFVVGKSTYLRSMWNQLDFFIVITSLMSFGLEAMTSGGQSGILDAVRVLRAVRPLRVISRSQNIQLVVQSLALSMVSMMHVVMVLLLFYLIFAILGTQMFQGLFYRCSRVNLEGDYMDAESDDEFFGVERPKYKFNRVECLDPTICPGCEWTKPFLHFDDVGSAMLTLFAVSTTDQWMEVLYDSMDAGILVDEAPKKDSNPGAFLYFVVFICIVGFALMNLFSGVVFYQFTRIKLKRQTNDALLTEHQKHWNLIVYSIANTHFPARVDPPQGKGAYLSVRKACFVIVTSNAFETGIMVCIMLVTFTMMLPHYGADPQFDYMLELSNYAFSGIFAVESVMKIVAFHWTQFWKSGWNRFDLVLVISSVLDVSTQFLSGSFLRVLRFGRLTRITRISRITRAARLAKGLKGVQSLVQCIMLSLASFWSVGTLLLLVFFIYSYIGVVLFRRVAHGESINDHANFETFGLASLTLLRVATMEAWVGLMEECSMGRCSSLQGSGGCGGVWATPFFCSFLVCVSTILLQLFTAVIIQNFEELESREKWPVPEDNMKQFLTVWKDVSQDARISVDDFFLVMERLPQPLGVFRNDGRPLLGTMHNAQVIRLLRNVELTVRPSSRRVFFYSTLYALAARVGRAEMPPGQLRKTLNAMVEQVFMNDIKMQEMLEKDLKKAQAKLNNLENSEEDDLNNDEGQPKAELRSIRSRKSLDSRRSVDYRRQQSMDLGVLGPSLSARSIGSLSAKRLGYDRNASAHGNKKTAMVRATTPTLQANLQVHLIPGQGEIDVACIGAEEPDAFDAPVSLAHIAAVQAMERGWRMREQRKLDKLAREAVEVKRLAKLAALQAQAASAAGAPPPPNAGKPDPKPKKRRTSMLGLARHRASLTFGTGRGTSEEDSGQEAPARHGSKMSVFGFGRRASGRRGSNASRSSLTSWMTSPKSPEPAEPSVLNLDERVSRNENDARVSGDSRASFASSANTIYARVMGVAAMSGSRRSKEEARAMSPIPHLDTPSPEPEGSGKVRVTTPSPLGSSSHGETWFKVDPEVPATQHDSAAGS